MPAFWALSPSNNTSVDSPCLIDASAGDCDVGSCFGLAAGSQLADGRGRLTPDPGLSLFLRAARPCHSALGAREPASRQGRGASGLLKALAGAEEPEAHFSSDRGPTRWLHPGPMPRADPAGVAVCRRERSLVLGWAPPRLCLPESVRSSAHSLEQQVADLVRHSTPCLRTDDHEESVVDAHALDQLTDRLCRCLQATYKLSALTAKASTFGFLFWSLRSTTSSTKGEFLTTCPTISSL